jgi:hypothetical protein
MFQGATTEEHYTATLATGEVITSNVPWVVTQVEPHSNFRLFVKFIDGTAGTVLMSERVFRKSAGVFAALSDPTIFAKVFVDDGVVTWQNGVDLAPDAMYDEIERNGVWVLR